MRFLSASVIYPIHEKPIPGGIIVIDNKGKILDLLDPAKNEIPSFLPLEKFEGILCPGFINAHCHLELSHLKGKFSQKKGLPFFIGEMVGKRNDDGNEIMKAMIEADVEMYENGIVAAGDISNTSDSTGIKKSGKILYRTFIELFDIFPDRAERIFNGGLDIQKLFNDAGLISSIVPHAPYTVSGKLMKLIFKEAETMNNIISIHNQETASEDEMFENGSGVLLDKLNKMTAAFNNWSPTGKSSLVTVIENYQSRQPLQLVHNTFTKEKDIQRAVSDNREIYWCLCVKANLFIENTIPDIKMLMKEGCVLTIGTDSYASNTSLSILDELKTISEKYPGIPLDEMLRWATLNGAAFLRMDNKFGSFEKGKTPGINLVTNIKPGGAGLNVDSVVNRVG